MAFPRSEADKIIARTVERLIMFGFSGKGVVFEAVGIGARKVLSRKDSKGLPLGPDRIKQLWEKHRPEGWERYWTDEDKQRLRPVRPRHLYTKESLRRRCPDGPLANLVEELLANGGHYSGDEVCGALSRDLDLSPKSEAALNKFAPRVGGRRKNGVEN